MLVNVTSKNFSELIFGSKGPVLLHFTDDTDSSQMQEVYLNHFSREIPNITIGRVNTRKDPSLAAMYGIQTTPAVKIFKKGRCVATASGLLDSVHLHQLMAK